MGDLLRLTRTELRRLRWRRAVLLLVAAAIVIPGLVWATSVWSTRPYSDAEIQRAREQALSQPGFERDVARCERHPHRYGADSAADCEEQMRSMRRVDLVKAVTGTSAIERAIDETRQTIDALESRG